MYVEKIYTLQSVVEYDICTWPVFRCLFSLTLPCISRVPHCTRESSWFNRWCSFSNAHPLWHPQDKDRPLSELQRDRFEDLLRGLTAERKDVRDAMVFALDNAESASEVVEILTEALTLPETPIPTKVWRNLCPDMKP